MTIRQYMKIAGEWVECAQDDWHKGHIWTEKEIKILFARHHVTMKPGLIEFCTALNICEEGYVSGTFIGEPGDLQIPHTTDWHDYNDWTIVGDLLCECERCHAKVPQDEYMCLILPSAEIICEDCYLVDHPDQKRSEKRIIHPDEIYHPSESHYRREEVTYND